MQGDDHARAPSAGWAAQTTTRIAIAFILTAAFVGIEALAGIWGRSLALLSDAGHNLTDVMALAVTWYALRKSARRPRMPAGPLAITGRGFLPPF